MTTQNIRTRMVESDPREILMQRRDELLKEMRALQNKAEGLGMAIKIIAEGSAVLSPSSLGDD